MTELLSPFSRLLRLFFAIFLIFCSTNVFSQIENTQSDSVRSISPADSLTLQDSIRNESLEIKADTLIKGSSKIQHTVNYSAEDSILFNVKQQKVYLYGDAKIDYGDIQLEADEIQIDFLNSTLTAKGVPDSTGTIKGHPIFKDGAETYQTENIFYNFETERAVISGMVTQQGDAYMHGVKVVKNEKNEIFIPEAKYTTCNLPEPHFHIEAKKLKVIPNEKVMTGPFHMEFNDVPTPLGFAFGMFPEPKKSKSGVLFPTYGEEKRRGFFLKNGGYFFDMNEYLKLALTCDLFSKGSISLNSNLNYKKRYSYSGALNLSYSRLTSGVEGDSSVTNDFWVRWNFTPETKGPGRFSANVNMGTSSYNVNNSENPQLNTRATFNSNVSYSTSFRGTPFSLGTSFRHSQNVRTNEITFQFPELSLSMNRIYPLRGIGSGSKGFHKNLSLSYNLTTTNEITNQVLVKNPETGLPMDSIYAFNFDNLPLFFENARNGGKHNIPIGTTMKVLKYFTISPSLNYSGLIYTKKLNYFWDEEEKELMIDTIPGLATTHTYNVAASLNTRLYGMYNFGGKVQAIRHVVTPSISYSLAPDFAKEKYGYYQEVQVDSFGTTGILSRYAGFVYGSPTKGVQSNMTFNVNNNIEMKVASKKDTVTGYKKVALLENLGFRASYNFEADSFKLSNINIDARTKIGPVSVTFGSTLDPYVYQVVGVNSETSAITQRRVDRYKWQAGQGVGQLARANFSLSTNLNPKARDSENNRQDVLNDAIDARANGIPLDPANLDPQLEEELNFIQNNPNLYTDFNIPWSLRISYNFNYSKVGYRESDITMAMNFSGDLSLTPKWKIRFQSGYDFENKKFTQTTLGITRDLHCWVMSLDWTPFGLYESYSLDIRVKSSLLQDLKMSKRSNFRDAVKF